jgi:hypothetical protein
MAKDKDKDKIQPKLVEKATRDESTEQAPEGEERQTRHVRHVRHVRQIR